MSAIPPFDSPIPTDFTPEDAPRRKRRRRRSFSINEDKRADIFMRVEKFYREDMQNRSADREARLQRYAKFRMWTNEPKDWPWENASDIAIPDMMEKSLRVQDTLHNAVMSVRPAINAIALSRTDKTKGETIDQLLDYQFFIEQDGERIVGDLADAFLNDGVFTAFVPWIKERREISEVRQFDPLPEDLLPEEVFINLLRRTFPNKLYEQKRSAWDWTVSSPDPEIDDSEPFDVRFYTDEEDRIEMVSERDVVVYDGPRVIPKDYHQVLYPVRAANLQIPSPSNPGGAAHVVLVDWPTIDEIKRLKNSGFYDLLTDEDIESMEAMTRSGADEEEEHQKDVLRGVSDETRAQRGAESHNRLTRLLCFDIFDIDGDGREEDVIWWVILESKSLARARLLGEVAPLDPPRRPLAEAGFLPVPGRRAAISLLEQTEALHDAMKMLFDQAIDFGTVQNVPFFFYRAQSSIKPEVIRLWPGEGYPLSDPQRDVNFPKFGGNTNQAFHINMMTLLGQMEERLTTVGDLQLGRVPAGKSSALRTIGGMALLAGQGEARPERILRRFFLGLTDVFRLMHGLNQKWLPKKKQILISNVSRPSDDPYLTISDAGEISGTYQFDFRANVLNTSKETLQQSLDDLMAVLINPLAIQLGIVGPEEIYRLFRDVGKSRGQNIDLYLREPSPGSMQPKLFAEEAIGAIMRDQIPEGTAAEGGGPMEHAQKLAEFQNSDMFGLLTPQQVDLFTAWFQNISEQAQLQMQQQALMQAAAQQQGGAQQNVGGRPPEQLPPNANVNPEVSSGNELIDESLPTAGGGTIQ